MDNNEQRNDIGLPDEPDCQIRLVVNNTRSNEDSIDLGSAFYNMKRLRHVFARMILSRWRARK